ncbi:hypothetical protein BD626DRAFT_494138 [Schizophyllum amplum]|uniref:Uncharacterized protein n=1 Tax=Schizophyllum amplum TaxID=97359 RepID=A0A550CEZ0_9AGAR|nr:hypothetical protein BD626DRAFT_494138 [Auriculariopsis ampla]
MPTIRFRRAASCLLRSSASRLDLRLPHSCNSDSIQDWAPGIRTYVKRQVLRAHIVYLRLEARTAITKSPSSLLYLPLCRAWTLRSTPRGQVEQKENLKIRKPQVRLPMQQAGVMLTVYTLRSRSLSPPTACSGPPSNYRAPRNDAAGTLVSWMYLPLSCFKLRLRRYRRHHARGASPQVSCARTSWTTALPSNPPKRPSSAPSYTLSSKPLYAASPVHRRRPINLADSLLLGLTGE